MNVTPSKRKIYTATDVRELIGDKRIRHSGSLSNYTSPNFPMSSSRSEIRSQENCRKDDDSDDDIICLDDEIVPNINPPVVRKSETASKKNIIQQPKSRTILHRRYPLNAVRNQRLEEHHDSLSFYVYQMKGVTLRNLDLIPSTPPLKIDKSKSFFVMSYNVLSQTTFEKHRELYGHLINIKYSWQSRWGILSKEFANLRSDIYCLQGVQNQRVVACYKVLFDKKGMNVFYTGRGGSKSDGCAIYWNPEKFIALARVSIKLDYETENFDRPNVAQLIHFKHIPSEKELIVVNSHLLFDPDRGDIKIYQLAVILAHIQKARTNNQPIIFCGDFNIYPDSPIYKLIMEGKLNCRETYCVPKSMSGQQRMFNQHAMQKFTIPAETKVTNDCTITEENVAENYDASETLSHKICFESVYSHYTHSKEKEVTAYGFLYNFNSDYIFYSVEKKENMEDNITKVIEDGLFLHRRLSLPDAKTMEQFSGPLPYYGAASDHLPLYAEFYLN